MLSKKDATFADVVPKRMAVAVMRFFELKDGKIITGVDVTYRKK